MQLKVYSQIVDKYFPLFTTDNFDEYGALVFFRVRSRVSGCCVSVEDDYLRTSPVLCKYALKSCTVTARSEE